LRLKPGVDPSDAHSVRSSVGSNDAFMECVLIPVRQFVGCTLGSKPIFVIFFVRNHFIKFGYVLLVVWLAEFEARIPGFTIPKQFAKERIAYQLGEQHHYLGLGPSRRGCPALC